MMNRRDKWIMWRPPGASKLNDDTSSSESSSSSTSSSSDTSEDDEMTLNDISVHHDND